LHELWKQTYDVPAVTALIGIDKIDLFCVSVRYFHTKYWIDSFAHNDANALRYYRKVSTLVVFEKRILLLINSVRRKKKNTKHTMIQKFYHILKASNLSLFWARKNNIPSMLVIQLVVGRQVDKH